MFDNIIPCTESLEQVKKVIDFSRIMKKRNIYIWCNKLLIPKLFEYYKGSLFDIISWHKTNTIKKLTTICNNKDKKKRLHPLLVLMAYGVYLAECRDSHKEIEFVKQSDTFLTSMVYDYAEQVEGFEERVVQKYGENWEKYRLVE